jgi:hypothetical protein
MNLISVFAANEKFKLFMQGISSGYRGGGINSDHDLAAQIAWRSRWLIAES